MFFCVDVDYKLVSWCLIVNIDYGYMLRKKIMKNELELSKVLLVYEMVMENGLFIEFGKIYEGIEVYVDYDGYNIFMCGNGVELKIGFYNIYYLVYE